jgi:hypothetical protein
MGPHRLCFSRAPPKPAPRNLIFSIAIGAENSFYVKSIATFALTFFGYIISVLASVTTLHWISSEEVEKKVRKKCMPRFLEKNFCNHINLS